MSRSIPRHLIERSWEIYLEHMLSGDPNAGQDPNQKLYYLGGFAAAIGVLVGTLPVGIPEGTLTRDVLSQIINNEIPRYQAEIEQLTVEAARLKREREH